MSVDAAQRFTRRRPCPICAGGDDMPRGKGKRCSGYLSSDERFAFCTREELAGNLEPQLGTEPATFRHFLEGDCYCGAVHGSGPAAAAESHFVYVDEQGAPLFRTVRLDGPEGKRIWQERAEGGAFVKGLGDARRVLYRLPGLDVAETVHVAEGERCADALAELGFVATCNPMGAGKWRDEYADVLACAFEVAIWADSDAQGRSHAETIARSLAGRVPRLRVIDLEPGREDGYDVADLFHDWSRNGRREDLRGAVEAIVAGAPLFEPPAAEEAVVSEPFLGRSHAEVLDLTFGDEPPELVEGLVPRGVLMLVAGLPETYKGWVCAKMAAIVAAGEGELFGRSACGAGPVGYFWQDDSTRNEAERVQLFARAHATPRDLPVRWFLNEGALLPGDLERLRATIEHYSFVLVVLDSVYNFAVGLDLKDRGIGDLFARLKQEVCDPTGCTLVLVDHMPWATEQNRKRLRSYGDVFKGAASRAGIYIDAEGSKLSVEARGNNIAGFKRTPAYWDEEALELRLVDTARQEEADEELDARVLEWLIERPGSHSTTVIRKGVKGNDTRIDSALERLRTSAEVQDHGRSGGPWSGRRGDGRYWIASVHAPETSAALFGPRLAEVESEGSERATSATSAPPRRGAEVDRAEVQDVLDEEREPTLR